MTSTELQSARAAKAFAESTVEGLEAALGKLADITYVPLALDVAFVSAAVTGQRRHVCLDSDSSYEDLCRGMLAVTRRLALGADAAPEAEPVRRLYCVS